MIHSQSVLPCWAAPIQEKKRDKDEPTRGIDVGAKYEIYCAINDMARAGKAVIVISSEMQEIIGTCDRAYIINEGRIAGELSHEELSQESIMKCIMDSNAKGEE